MQTTILVGSLVAPATIASGPTDWLPPWLGSRPVHAEVTDGPIAGRFELGLGVGRRDDRLVTPDVRATADGGALSDLELAAVWFGARSHLGLAGHLNLERFALRTLPSNPGQRVDVLGGTADGGVVWRTWAWQRRLTFELGAGYGLLRLPVVRIGGAPNMRTIAPASSSGHGPVLTVALALGPPGPIGVELGAAWRPITFGASYLGLSADPTQTAARIRLRVGRWAAGPIHWSGLITAEVARQQAQAQGIDIEQTSQHVRLGIQANWPGRATAPPAQPETSSVTLSGLVRSEQGSPIPARLRIDELGLERRADALGRFRFDVPPGRYTLFIDARGFVPQEKAFQVDADEQRIFDIYMQVEVP